MLSNYKHENRNTITFFKIIYLEFVPTEVSKNRIIDLKERAYTSCLKWRLSNSWMAFNYKKFKTITIFDKFSDHLTAVGVI